MRIAAILHKAGGTIDDVFSKMENASAEADVVVAPDYALSCDIDRPNSRKEYEWVSERLADLSSRYAGLIIPGTMALQEERTLKVVCPVYKDGQKIKELQKKRSSPVEGRMAQRFRLDYSRGDSSQNYISYQNGSAAGSIAVEICADHGSQKIPDNTFLELVLAYDQKAGFYQGATTPKFKRHILVNDSFRPKISAYLFDEDGEFGFWNPEKKITGAKIFRI